MSRKRAAAVAHHAIEIDELRADRELAVEYLKAAMESLDDPDDRAAGLLALRTVAEAYGGLGAVAREAFKLTVEMLNAEALSKAERQAAITPLVNRVSMDIDRAVDMRKEAEARDGWELMKDAMNVQRGTTLSRFARA